MKVLQLVPDTLENPSGGMGEQSVQLLRRLNCSVTVIGAMSQDATSYGPGKQFIPMTALQIPIVTINPHFHHWIHQSDWLATAMQLPRHDIVHAFDWNAFYPAALLSRVWDAPLVITVQLPISQMMDDMAMPDVDAEIANTLRGLELFGLTNADHIIQVSNSCVRGMSALFSKKTSVIGNGIDIKEWEDWRPTELPGNRKYKVVFLGRLSYQKGVHNLLRAVIPTEVDLIYIGGIRGSNSELQDEIIRQSKEREGVHYLGPLYGNHKIGALQAADAVVMPSVHEPFGIVALEALASKSILLSSFVNGMSDFLTEDVAINCGTAPESISAAMRRIVSMDDSEKQNRVAAGLKICVNHDWNQIVKQLESVYDQCLRMERAA